MKIMKRTVNLRKWLVCTVLFGVSVSLRGQEPRTLHLNLPQAIDIALNENPTIRVAEQNIELKKVGYKEAWQTLLPTVDLSGGINYTVKAATMNLNGNKFKMGKDATSTWNGVLSVSLPLYAPGVYRTMKLSKMDIELAAEQSRASRIDMINQVKKAYYQLLLSQDSYEVLQESYAYSEQNYQVVKAKYEQGSVSEYDKISAEVQMRNIQPNVVAARNAVRLAEVQLKVLLGISDADLALGIKDNLKNYETEVAAESAFLPVGLQENTTMKQFDLNEQMLNQTLKVQKSNFIPTLALGFQLQTQSLYNDNFKFWDYEWAPSSTLGLTLSVPLYRASNFTKVKSTRIQLRQLAENRINTERQLKMQIEACQDNMQASTEQMASNKESVAQAEKGRMIAEKRYEVGKGTILELNSSEVALTQAQLVYNQAIYDFLVAKSELEYIEGKER